MKHKFELEQALKYFASKDISALLKHNLLTAIRLYFRSHNERRSCQLLAGLRGTMR